MDNPHELRVVAVAEDYDKALSFYRDALGLPVQEVFDHQRLSSSSTRRTPRWLIRLRSAGASEQVVSG